MGGFLCPPFFLGGEIMYTERNFETKKALREALRRGEKIRYYQPGPFAVSSFSEGEVFLEGPHPHTWHAKAKVKGWYIISIK